MLGNLQGIRRLVLTKSSKFIQSRVISARSAAEELNSKCCQRKPLCGHPWTRHVMSAVAACIVTKTYQGTSR